MPSANRLLALIRALLHFAGVSTGLFVTLSISGLHADCTQVRAVLPATKAVVCGFVFTV